MYNSQYKVKQATCFDLNKPSSGLLLEHYYYYYYYYYLKIIWAGRVARKEKGEVHTGFGGVTRGTETTWKDQA